jgi:hypothetical protein
MELQGLEAQIDVPWRGYHRRIVINFVGIFTYHLHSPSVFHSFRNKCFTAPFL